jgi:hydrogenase-1 operon protein HyaF
MQTESQIACSAAPGDIATGNVTPLLHEVRHALQGLLECGQETVIDLRSLPMGPGEEEQIVEQLGRGEVQVRLSALGPSEIIESRYPGVWLVTHRNNDGDVIGKFIEICAIPRLVTAQNEDIHAGLQQLGAQLAE